VIPLLLALAAAAPAPAPAPSTPGSFKACADLVRSDPERAAAGAAEWFARGGGLDALNCRGLALVALERWSDAAAAFEQAALQAEQARDHRRADFRVEAGNAWLAAGDPARARAAFDAALASNLMTPPLQGEVLLDRARAGVAAGDPGAARADIDKALALVPTDPFAWYLSAALARRERNVARARSDIAKSVALAPDDAAILLEAGNIAGLGGDVPAARGFYARAARAAPDTPIGRSAEAALAENGGENPAPETPAVPPKP
jgi:tetratricopeptide (TPR) repeat protein